jgi:ABC-type antimicrobial peptide transport system permease subunit
MSFPITDLLRRRNQTALAALSIIMSVASTLFLLLLSDQIGYGITSTASQILTSGINNVLSRFIVLVEVLVFVAGAIIVLFTILLMMDQKKKDVGLIKAIGCQNTLAFSYFMIELLILSVISCVAGIIIGFIANWIFVNFSGFTVSTKSINLWFGLLVFALYFSICIFFGSKPLLKSARQSPVKAMSPIKYYGLIKTDTFKPVSKFGVTIRIALRSLYRRQDTILRLVVFMSMVFSLLTISIAGGQIGSDTTQKWITNSETKDIVIIGHAEVVDQFELIFSKFSEYKESDSFNYLNPSFRIPDLAISDLNVVLDASDVEPRLIVSNHVHEISNFTVDPETMTTIPIGDKREAEALIIGVEPEKGSYEGYYEGRFLRASDEWQAVIGDSLGQEIFDIPLVQSLEMNNRAFQIVGVRIDPINNGRTVYVPIEPLQNITGFNGFNLIAARVDDSQNREATIITIEEISAKVSDRLAVRDLKKTLEANTSYLDALWSSITVISLFSLIPAILCLLSYWSLLIEDQKREFGILRVIGLKPRNVISISSIQSAIVLISSWSCGTSLGIVATLLILIPEPSITSLTVLTIITQVILVPAAIFIMSLFPAKRITDKPTIDNLNKIF